MIVNRGDMLGMVGSHLEQYNTMRNMQRGVIFGTNQ